MLHLALPVTLAKIHGYKTGLGYTFKELILAGNSFGQGAERKLLHPVSMSVAFLQL